VLPTAAVEEVLVETVTIATAPLADKSVLLPSCHCSTNFFRLFSQIIYDARQFFNALVFCIVVFVTNKLRL